MAVDQTVKNFKSIANQGTTVTLVAMLAGFLAAAVAKALIEPRRDLPDEAYGVVVVAVAATYEAHGGPHWKSVALGGGFSSAQVLADLAQEGTCPVLGILEAELLDEELDRSQALLGAHRSTSSEKSKSIA